MIIQDQLVVDAEEVEWALVEHVDGQNTGKKANETSN